MKYIDADKLKMELEKRLKNVRDYMNGAGMKYKGPKYFKAQGKESAYDALLSIIDSLQQEQPEVDLEKELEEWMKIGPHTSFPWCTIPDAIKITAEHFYELGLNAGRV